MKIPNFVSRMEQLNGYILLLLCQKNLTTLASPTIRRMNCSFPENELAIIILKCFPRQFKNHYYLYNMVPAEIGQLRDKVMQIKKVVGKQKQEASANAATVVEKNDLLKKSLKTPKSRIVLAVLVRDVASYVHSMVVQQILTTPRIVASMILTVC